MPIKKTKRSSKMTAKKLESGIAQKMKMATKKVQAKVAALKKEMAVKVEKIKKEAFDKGFAAGSKHSAKSKKAATGRKVAMRTTAKKRGRPASK